MNCLRVVMQKILIEKYKKYNFLGFKFGPELFIKIQVNYHECGKFSIEIIDGLPLKNFEKIFSESIEKAKNEIVKELTFVIRRKNILKDIHKIHKPENPSSTKGSFDELTTRMRRNRKARDHECALNPSEVIIDEKEVEYDKYFGDTSKIVNRQTKI